jgi:hypothetical protein
MQMRRLFCEKTAHRGHGDPLQRPRIIGHDRSSLREVLASRFHGKMLCLDAFHVRNATTRTQVVTQQLKQNILIREA